MNDPKAFDSSGANAGFQGVFSDPLALATKPAVIFKFASSVSCAAPVVAEFTPHFKHFNQTNFATTNRLQNQIQVLSLVIYSCVSSAWYEGRCLFNRYNGICRFGSLALISFLACFVLLVLELLFGHISSLKVKKRIAVGDVIVSGVNTIFYLLLFVFLAIAWLKSDYPPFGHSINCCRVAILLSFLAIFALAACTGLAYVRYQSGLDMSQFMSEEQIKQEQAQYYDQAGNYQSPAFQDQYAPDGQVVQDYAMDPQAQQQQYSNNYANNYDPNMGLQ